MKLQDIKQGMCFRLKGDIQKICGEVMEVWPSGRVTFKASEYGCYDKYIEDIEYIPNTTGFTVIKNPFGLENNLFDK